MPSELEREIEKLRDRKVLIVNKMNRATSDEREEYEEELKAIQRQIDVLERMKK
ncbi:MAG: hypothetical protein HYT70_03940 [Candidatus Aenigmarchaeota archaeon]|nr:hypothetical protein [Candidatus Aenigmarchaeota archaeon]